MMAQAIVDDARRQNIKYSTPSGVIGRDQTGGGVVDRDQTGGGGGVVGCDQTGGAQDGKRRATEDCFAALPDSMCGLSAYTVLVFMTMGDMMDGMSTANTTIMTTTEPTKLMELMEPATTEPTDAATTEPAKRTEPRTDGAQVKHVQHLTAALTRTIATKLVPGAAGGEYAVSHDGLVDGVVEDWYRAFEAKHLSADGAKGREVSRDVRDRVFAHMVAKVIESCSGVTEAQMRALLAREAFLCDDETMRQPTRFPGCPPERGAVACAVVDAYALVGSYFPLIVIPTRAEDVDEVVWTVMLYVALVQAPFAWIKALMKLYKGLECVATVDMLRSAFVAITLLGDTLEGREFARAELDDRMRVFYLLRTFAGACPFGCGAHVLYGPSYSMAKFIAHSDMAPNVFTVPDMRPGMPMDFPGLPYRIRGKFVEPTHTCCQNTPVVMFAASKLRTGDALRLPSPKWQVSLAQPSALADHLRQVTPMHAGVDRLERAVIELDRQGVAGKTEVERQRIINQLSNQTTSKMPMTNKQVMRVCKPLLTMPMDEFTLALTSTEDVSKRVQLIIALLQGDERRRAELAKMVASTDAAGCDLARCTLLRRTLLYVAFTTVVKASIESLLGETVRPLPGAVSELAAMLPEALCDTIEGSGDIGAMVEMYRTAQWSYPHRLPKEIVDFVGCGVIAARMAAAVEKRTRMHPEAMMMRYNLVWSV